ncbi:hypothetical protein TRVL_07362 [Trypanosoma vivax]|nr:hypothetical protein TRVL_07362 [Trypanosoma vivax]
MHDAVDPCAAPLVVDVSDVLPPLSLRRVRMYVDLLASPPPSAHPFRAFLEDTGAMCNPARLENGIPDREDVCPLSLLEALRGKHGHSAGTAMHRTWVCGPQAFLSSMSRLIADCVRRRALPLVDRKSGNGSCVHPSTEAICGDEATNQTASGGVGTKSYDIHVRYFPTKKFTQFSHVFCAEVIVRDAVELRRMRESVRLMDAQYAIVGAKSQTVKSSMDFWRAVSTHVMVENDGLSPVGGDPKAVVLGSMGSADSLTGYASAVCVDSGRCVTGTLSAGVNGAWVQPPAKRPREATCVGRVDGYVSSRGGLHAVGDEELLKQSDIGLVAVFYLAFNGVLYAGNATGTTAAPPSTRSVRGLNRVVASAETPQNSTGDGSIDEVGARPKSASEHGASNESEPVFFLPCTSTTSFVRGVLGL